MAKILQTQSKLTDRYQTTIPSAIRDSLRLHKRDKIMYSIEANGKVSIARAEDNDDPVLAQFLSFLASSIQNNAKQVQFLCPTLLKRAKNLVAGVKIDLEAPLNDQDV